MKKNWPDKITITMERAGENPGGQSFWHINFIEKYNNPDPELIREDKEGLTKICQYAGINMKVEILEDGISGSYTGSRDHISDFLMRNFPPP